MKNYRKIFYRFLKEKEAYQPFIYNILTYNQLNYHIINDTLKRIDNKTSPIGSSFFWNNTKQGVKFWQDLHCESQKLLNNSE